MATISVSSASQLASALKTATGGDVIRLAGGDYGDFSIVGKNFASDVTITSADPSNPAVFNTLTIKSSSNIDFHGINVDFQPTMATVSFASAVMVDRSKGIEFSNGYIKGEPSVNGVPASATSLDATGNVIGQPTGRAMTIQGSSDITVEHMNISSFLRGIVMGDSEKITISDNEIHHLRKTAIMGDADDLVIEGNYLHSSNPWRIGEPGGDHADFIALWTDARQVGPTTNVTIRDNVLSQGDGGRILGMWLAGNGDGYKNVIIEGNAILGGDHQGIMLTNVVDGIVRDNTLLQTTSYAKSPGILLRTGTKNIEVSDNLTWSVADAEKGGTGNTITDNILIQKTNPLAGGFYDSALISKLAGMLDADAIYSLVSTGVGGGVITVPSKPPPTTTAPDTDAPTQGVDHILIGTSQANHLVGGTGNDTLDGRGGADTLVGGQGDDTYVVPNSQATIVEEAGGGIDTVVARGNYVLGSNLENLIISDTANNSWTGTGNELNNVLTGNAGNNLLQGLAGNDTISGGLGNDTLVGGEGDDKLTGGEGADVFRFAKGSGHDVITDFGFGGRDAIDVQAYLKAGLKPVVHDTGHDTVISFGTGETITLTGVDAHHVSATATGFVYV